MHAVARVTRAHRASYFYRHTAYTRPCMYARARMLYIYIYNLTIHITMYIFFFLRDKVNFEGRKEHWREGREGKRELRRRGRERIKRNIGV